jgi:hypothetical protein
MPLDLTAVPVRPSVVAGEALAVVSTLRNTGTAPLRVPVAPLLVFTVIPQQGERLELSSARYLMWLRRGEPNPPQPMPTRNLPPGARVEVTDDLALYAHEELKPGKYRVHAEYRAGGEAAAAPPFEVVVEPVAAKHFSVGWEPARSLEAAHDQDAGGGKAVVLVRSSAADLPQDGTGVRTLESTNLRSLAVAVNVDGRDPHPWFAVLQGNKPGFGRAGPKMLLGWVEGPEIGISDARLLTPGWLLRDRVLFAAVGAGQARLLSLGTKPSDDPIGIEIDDAMKLGPVEAFAKQAPADVLPVLDAKAGVVHLLWSDGSRVRRRGIALAGGVDKESVLIERERPILALAAAPVREGAAASVRVLFGPERKGGPLLYARVPLDSAGKAAETEVAAPDAQIDAWGLCVEEDAPPFVLAHAGKALLLWRPGSDGWTKIADAPAASHLRVLRSWPTEWWAEWIDPRLGLRHAPIHGP